MRLSCRAQSVDDAKGDGGVYFTKGSDGELGNLSLDDGAHVATEIRRGDDKGRRRT